MAQPIAFHFDFSSPYGYLATFRIEELAARHGRTVAWKPFLLGIAMKVTGMTPLIGQPLRGDYARRDLARMARDFGAPFTWPENFPFHSVAASRAFYWLADRDPDQAKALARAVYHAYWGEGRDVAKPDRVVEVARGIGIDEEALAAALGDEAVKQRLKEETDAAIEAGIFGSPMFTIDGEPFWGCDKFDQMDHWLASGGW